MRLGDLCRLQGNHEDALRNLGAAREEFLTLNRSSTVLRTRLGILRWSIVISSQQSEALVEFKVARDLYVRSLDCRTVCLRTATRDRVTCIALLANPNLYFVCDINNILIHVTGWARLQLHGLLGGKRQQYFGSLREHEVVDACCANLGGKHRQCP